MSVKTIFKTLIGTVVIMVLASVFIELFNVNTVGTQIKQMCSMSIDQSCELFTQETYRTLDSDYKAAGATRMDDITIPGSSKVYISGDFYGATSKTQIWYNLYGSENSPFSEVVNLYRNGSKSFDVSVNGKSSKVKYTIKEISGSIQFKNIFNNSDTKHIRCIFTNLNNLYNGVNNTAGFISAYNLTTSFGSSETDLSRKSEAVKAYNMKTQQVTPVNIGFPYMDATVTNKIFQWNLAQLLMKGNEETIQKDESGQYYINYNGFRCYVNKAFITKFNYYILDGSTSEGRDKIRELVDIDTSELNYGTSSSSLSAENKYVTIVGIEYTIPISYQGVTPLKNIFNYVWSKEVEGYNDTYDGVVENQQSYSTSTQNMSGSGGVLETNGEIYYTLIR